MADTASPGINSAALGRSVLGVIMGVVIGGILISMTEMLGHRLFPLPNDLGPLTPERCSDVMKLLRPVHLLPVGVAWFIGATAGGALAGAVAQRRPLVHSSLVAAFFLSGAIFTLKQCQHPAWFNAVGPLVFLPAAWLVCRALDGRGRHAAG
ncbi:MAG: hypothetical protein E6Q99_02420 [Elusimicrobia bacterium]|nr:MAG: hypothetical protein E6Q99_02420 [Elusimicrobiota bacterium]